MVAAAGDGSAILVGPLRSFPGRSSSLQRLVGSLLHRGSTVHERIRPPAGSRRAARHALDPPGQGLQALLVRPRQLDRDDLLIGLALLSELGLPVAPLRLPISPLSRSIASLGFLVALFRSRVVRNVSTALGSGTVTEGGLLVMVSRFPIAPSSLLLLGVLSGIHRTSPAPDVASAGEL